MANTAPRFLLSTIVILLKSMKEKLQKEISAILTELGVQNPKAVLDYPVHFEMGDLSTNVVMAYAKELKVKPLDLANKIVTHLEVELPSGVKAEVAPPGFINFFFSPEYFVPKTFEKLGTFKGQKTIQYKGYFILINT